MLRAVDRLKSKIKPDTVVMLFFGGYGVQAGRESYMIPVDARIWKEGDVRRQGVSVDCVLDGMKEQGAKAKLVVIDASRRNPYERRFRSYLAWPRADQRARQRVDPVLGHARQGRRRLQGREQRAGRRVPHQPQCAGRAESVFNKTRVAISRASDGEQVPTVSSSLLEDVRFGG